jgi:gliding motility-associated-like protein
MEEDYTGIVVEWAPVPGAVTYNVTSSQGTGVLNGTTYSITGLKDDSPVTITVEPIGDNDCPSSSSTIECHTLAYIPANVFLGNVFSPNFDGVNDVFYIQSNNEVVNVIAFQIYDRWGNLVFEDFNFPPNDPDHGWDGMVKGEIMNPAVFTYTADILTTSGEILKAQGDVTLVR